MKRQLSAYVQYAKRDRLLYLAPVLLLILGDIFFFTISSDIRILGILLFFGYLVKRFTLYSAATFKFSLILFLLAYFLYIFSDPAIFHQPTVPPVEKLSVWLYLFLVIGVIQKWRE